MKKFISVLSLCLFVTLVVNAQSDQSKETQSSDQTKTEMVTANAGGHNHHMSHHDGKQCEKDCTKACCANKKMTKAEKKECKQAGKKSCCAHKAKSENNGTKEGSGSEKNDESAD